MHTKKNLYYHAVYQRTNMFKAFFMGLFHSLCSWPRLLLEVFIRKNFGERYFSFSTSIFLFLLLIIFPYTISSYSYRHGNIISLIAKHWSWYLFALAFIYFANERRKEMSRLASVFDFARFSLSTGTVDQRFYKIKISKTPTTIRLIMTVFEPALFLLVGLVLMLFAQPVGILITICSILYSASYFASYWIGDDYIMDMIDKIICGEEIVDSFVNDKDSSLTRGFNAMGRKPINKDARRKIVEKMFEDEDYYEDAT